MKTPRPLSALLGLFICGLLAASPAMGDSPAMLAPTPPMGWNSWNWFGKKEINEQLIREVIDAMAANGMREAGYNYVVVDGGWRDTKLGPGGELRAHPEKFPHGMKALADYAHSKGFKFGLHTVPGDLDCGGDPVGGFGHEAVQVKQFVDWGLDFIKLDRCRLTSEWNDEILRTTYLKWTSLLAHCGRPIVLSLSAYKYFDWYPQAGQMGRTTGDIRCRIHGGAIFDGQKKSKMSSVMSIADLNNASAAFAGPGYWNDADMLVTGDRGLTQDEQTSHFALWCVMSSPLMLGDDPRNLTPEEKAIVLNHDAISINQEPTEQGRRLSKNGDAEVWAKKLTGNRLAVLLLNRSSSKTNLITADWKTLGLSGEMNVKDVFENSALAPKSDEVSLSCPPHGCHLLLLTPAETTAQSR